MRLGFIFIYKGKEFEEKFVFEVLTLCFLSPVLFQQTFTDIEHTGHLGRCYDILPALLLDLLGEVASDDIAGSDPLQQLLRFLQTPPRQNSLGKGLFLLPAHLSAKEISST